MRIKDAGFDSDGEVGDDADGKDVAIFGDYLYSWLNVHIADLRGKLERSGVFWFYICLLKK